MNYRTLPVLVVLVLSGCDDAHFVPALDGGSGGATGAAGGGVGGTGGGVGGVGGRTAVSHRAVAISCGNEPRTAGMCTFANSTSPGGCTMDAECTAGPNGRCLGLGRIAACSCSYDTCFADSDCGASGGPCVCRASSAGANTCLAGNCRIDADCGRGGSCSPSNDFGCGSYKGIVGYFCHTTQDACLDDSDCAAGECRHDPATGAWACATSICAG